MLKKFLSQSIPVSGALLAVVLLAVPGAWAGEGDSHNETTQPTAEAAAPAAQHLRVVVDPETGKIVSVPQGQPGSRLVISQMMLRRMDSSVDDLEVETAPLGAKKVDLKRRFFSPLVAVVGTDGRLHLDHATLAPDVDPSAEETIEQETEEAGDDR